MPRNNGLTTGIALATVLLLLALVPQLTIAQDPPDGICTVSLKPPTKPDGLEFCHAFNDRACCIPPGDLESLELFYFLVDLGLSCSISKHSVKNTYRFLRQWYCLGCDPDEPRYRFLTRSGDIHLPGGQNSPNPLAPAGDWTWRVCSSFVRNVWGINGTMYDQCGIKPENPCGGTNQWFLNTRTGQYVDSGNPILDGWDPYQCGDTIVIPSSEYGSGVELLGALEPPNFGDYNFKFVVTDETAPGFDWDITPCFKGGVAVTGGSGSRGGVDQRMWATLALAVSASILVMVAGL